MCSDNPNLPKEANKAKCFLVACFVFSVFSMVGFLGGTYGIIGGVSGVLACVASSIIMCCGPKSTEQGGGKFTAAGVLLLLSGIAQLIMGIVQIGFMISFLNENGNNEKKYCDDRYFTCDVDTSGENCKDGWYYTDSVCSKDYVTERTSYDDYSEDNLSDTETSCDTQSLWDLCKLLHGAADDAVKGIVIVLYGIGAAFLLIAGLLNALGGAYCFKAKSAIETKPAMPFAMMPAAVPAAMPVASAVPVQGQVIAPKM